MSWFNVRDWRILQDFKNYKNEMCTGNIENKKTNF